MRFLTLSDIKFQCRIPEEQNHEDSYLEFIGKAAEQEVEGYLNRRLFVDAVPEDVSNGLVVTENIKLAMLLKVGHYYENREATSDVVITEVPHAYQELLGRYRMIDI